mmetsp:Transcript_36535/g.92373  ORF Transcript_36535/g.92373 Transcript_36535/m.92373 type:complete len:957 (-) Transcript_36535:3-2873(-)
MAGGSPGMHGKRLPRIELDHGSVPRTSLRPEPLPEQSGGGRLAAYSEDGRTYVLSAAGEAQLQVLRQLLQAAHLGEVLRELGQKGGSSVQQHPALVLADMPQAERLAAAIMQTFWTMLTGDAWELLAEVASIMEPLAGERSGGAMAAALGVAGRLLASVRKVAALQDAPVALLGKLPPQQLQSADARGLAAYSEAVGQLPPALEGAAQELADTLYRACQGEAEEVETPSGRTAWLQAFEAYWRLQRCVAIVMRCGAQTERAMGSPGHELMEPIWEQTPAAARPTALMQQYAALRASQLAAGSQLEALPAACAAELRRLSVALHPGGVPRWAAGCPVIFRGTVPCVNLRADSAAAAAGCLPPDTVVPVGTAPASLLLGDVPLQWRPHLISSQLQADGVEAAAGPEGWREEALALARLGYAVMLTELRALLQDGDPGLSPALGWRLLAPSPSGSSAKHLSGGDTTAAGGGTEGPSSWSWAVAVVEVAGPALGGAEPSEAQQGVVARWAASMSAFSAAAKGSTLTVPPDAPSLFCSAPMTAALGALQVGPPRRPVAAERLATSAALSPAAAAAAAAVCVCVCVHVCGQVLREALPEAELQRDTVAAPAAGVLDMEELLHMATHTMQAAVNWVAHLPKLFPSSATVQGLCLLHSDSLQLRDAAEALLDAVQDRAALGAEGRRGTLAGGRAARGPGAQYGPGTSVDTGGAGLRAMVAGDAQDGPGAHGEPGWRAGTPSSSLLAGPVEAAAFSRLRGQFAALQLGIGALTDMLAEEFREAARKLWACAPAARWDVELGPTTPSSGASAVADQLLRPLQASLRVLDRRSADALFPAAVSAAIHAELEAVAEGMRQVRRLAASRITGQQLQLDARAMRSASAGGASASASPQGVSEVHSAAEVLDLAPAAREHLAPIFRRMDLVAELLMAPNSAIKGTSASTVEGAPAWRQLPDCKRWISLRRG